MSKQGKQVIRSIPAALAVLTLALAPAIAEARHRHRREPGLYLSIGHHGGFVFGYRDRRYHSHYEVYQETLHSLVAKRGKLIVKTQRALSHEDFGQTQRLLAKLVRVDQDLREHRESHRHCRH